jgi:adenylate cyclase class IV
VENGGIMRFREIETKYDADKIKMEDFLKIIDKMPIRKKLMVSSYDEYFTNTEGDFVRYRHNNDHGELTIKRKTKDSNNNQRVEVNLPTRGDNVSTVKAFLNLLGYQHNFSIYKTCNIFWTDKVDLVYYVVYDQELKERRRFIEIEADESLDWTSEEEAWNEILKYERMLEPLGITPQHRLRKSLFEIFKAGT